MEIKREDLNACTVKLEITCDPGQIKEGVQKAVKEASKAVRIPGFRPGHAPRALVEQQISKEGLSELAAEHIMAGAYKKAISELDLKPYTKGVVTLNSIDVEAETCEMTAKVPPARVVEIGDYESFPVEVPLVDVTDDEVDEQFEGLRKQQATRHAVSGRGVEESDVAVVNIKAEGEEGDGRNFMIVVGKTFPQMDQALVGMNVEEMKQLELSFPDTFQENDWAGKQFKCQLTLRSLSSVQIPEDEEFASKMKFEDAGTLRTRLREMLERQKKEAVDEYVAEQVIEALMQRSSVCVPDTMWEAVANEKLDDVQEGLEKAGKSFSDYVKEKGMTEEEFIEAQKQEAKVYVMRAQLIQDLFIKENMTVSNEDLSDELYQMSVSLKMQPKELVAAMEKNGSVRELYYQAIHRKVMEFLKGRVQAKEVARV